MGDTSAEIFSLLQSPLCDTMTDKGGMGFYASEGYFITYHLLHCF